ncbi:MAG: hypothetical protein D3903_09525 [Candidatus Electrothrix sp. GM3_4]|nr:hypothetical protein [Candidatus Electrothrix sp. GM3_4]
MSHDISLHGKMLGKANFSSCQHLLQGFFTKIKYDSRGIKKRSKQVKIEKIFLFRMVSLFYFFNFQRERYR